MAAGRGRREEGEVVGTAPSGMLLASSSSSPSLLSGPARRAAPSPTNWGV
jgi:hypothetical protein